MASYYETIEDLQVTDPVCLVPGQPGKVAKATPTALRMARAVLGIALGAAHGGEVVTIGDAGAIPVATWDPTARVTGCGPLLVARGGHCERVTGPEPGDYTIGVLRADGTLIIQRDYELSLATHRMINVKDFGAVGDGITDDSDAFEAALTALPTPPPPHDYASRGTVIFIPPGVYRLAQNLELRREVHLLGGGGPAGGAGVILNFTEEGCGIIVHSNGSTPVAGQWAAGCLIEGLRIIGTPPRGRHHGVLQPGLPARWQSDTDYAVGDRVCAYRPLPDGTIQGYRYFYWECVRGGRSGATPPDIWTYPPITSVQSRFAAHRAHIVDFSTEWQPNTPYRAGQVVRAPHRFDVIFVKTTESTAHVSGPSVPDWNAGSTVTDNGIHWLRRDASPYLLDEGADRPVWSCQVHAGVRAHMVCEVKRCMIENFLNAGIWIGTNDQWYPDGNTIGWRIEDVRIGTCGTGVCVQGNKAHQGVATNITVGAGWTLGSGNQPIDWSPAERGGNGGIAFCDLSYYGNQWSACTNEVASDRALVCEGIGQASTITNFWDEGTYSRQGVFLSGYSMIIGGQFNNGIDKDSVTAAVKGKDFRQVEEVNYRAPRQTRAMLHQPGADSVFMWTANRAMVGNEYANTIGWRSLLTPRRSTPPELPGFPALQDAEWALSYQSNSPHEFFSVQDGFGALGMSWRDHLGHFCGRPGSEYFLGVSWDAESNNEIRHGFRALGDRFEPRVEQNLLRGRFLGRIVVEKGFRARDSWNSGGNYSAFNEAAGWAPSTIKEQGYVFVCTHTGRAGGADGARPDFVTAINNRRDPRRAALLSPVFASGLLVSPWVANQVQQPGMLKRVRAASDGLYYLFVPDRLHNRGRTGRSEPSWICMTDILTEDTIPADATEVEVRWRCLGPDPDNGCIIEEPGRLQWTCVGPVATFAAYGPIYEKATRVTSPEDSEEWVRLDQYPIATRTCSQYDVVVTALGDSTHPGQPAIAATFTLRAACYHDGGIARLLGDVNVDRRRTRDDVDAMMRLEADGGWIMSVYVRRGEDARIRWQSIRRPHTDADWG